MAGAADAPLAIEDYLGLTVFQEVRVSPDGGRIAVVTTRDDFAANRTEQMLARIVVDDQGRRMALDSIAAGEGNFFDLRWSPDGAWLTWLANRLPGTVPLLFGLRRDDTEPIVLTERKAHRFGIGAYDWMPDSSGLIIAAPLPRDAATETAWRQRYGDVMRFPPQPPRTGLFRLARAGFGTAPAQPLGEVAHTVIEVAAAPAGDRFAFVALPAVQPRLFFDGFADSEVWLHPLGDADGAEPPRRLTDNHLLEADIRWAPDGNSLYAAGSGAVGSDRTRWTQGRLFRIDAKKGTVRRLAPGFPGDFNAPIGEAPFVLLADGRLLAAGNESTAIDLYEVAADGGSVRQRTAFGGQVGALSASTAGEVIAFVRAGADAYPELFVAGGLDRLDRARRFTRFNGPRSDATHPAIETIEWKNGDGDRVEGVLFRPPGIEPGAAAEPLPLVVDLHGGPWQARIEAVAPNSQWNFNRPAPLFAARGYLVLEPNYRGSTGRGDPFLHAVEGYSCSRPVDDILTGVDSLVARGLVDPARVAVIGYSYGGLLVNCLIGRTDRFAAAVSGAGIWNDISYFGTADNWVQTDVRYDGRAPWEDFERYWRESPISAAANIRTPTLVAIGGRDQRIPTSQGYEMYRALMRLGVPSELLVFPGEDHRFQRPAHKRILVQNAIDWIGKFLKR